MYTPSPTTHFINLHTLSSLQELENLGYAEGKKAQKPGTLKKQAEFFKWGRVCQIGDSANPDDVTKWTVMIRGGPAVVIAGVGPSFSTVYAGAVFKVRIEFPRVGYPFRAPEFKFVADAEASIPFHPNVTSAGDMVHSHIIGVDWKGTMDAFFILKKIHALLTAPSLMFTLPWSPASSPYLVFNAAAAGDKDAALTTFREQAAAACPASFSPAAKAAFVAVAVPFLDASFAAAQGISSSSGSEKGSGAAGAASAGEDTAPDAGAATKVTDAVGATTAAPVAALTVEKGELTLALALTLARCCVLLHTRASLAHR